MRMTCRTNARNAVKASNSVPAYAITERMPINKCDVKFLVG